MTELKLRTGGATHRGAHRENNEDSMVVAGSLCVVADGMGGHEAGEVASRLCVRQLAYSPFFTMPGGRSEEEQQAYAERLAAIDESDPAKRRRREMCIRDRLIYPPLRCFGRQSARTQRYFSGVIHI